MARGVNKCILIGNLGGDPETRYLPNGNAVANLTLATSDSWKDKSTGEKKERTEWHRVCVFGKLAEIVGKYLHKGSKVYVEGRLQTRKWQDKTGSDKYTTEVVVDIGGTMQFLDGPGDRKATENAARPAQAPNASQPGGQQAPAPPEGFDDETTPF